MTENSNHNLQYRPESYFEPSKVELTALSRIKGEKRRRIAKDLAEGRNPEDLDYLESMALAMLQDSLASEELDEQKRDALGKLHPSFMGGEFLPSLPREEVEIARIALESTTADVISVRARAGDGKIRYSVVDEYESDFNVDPQESDLPLTMEELVRLIDRAGIGLSVEEDGEANLTDSFRDMNLSGVGDPAELIDFVTVSSEFYPQLEGYYRERALAWADRVHDVARAEDEIEDPRAPDEHA